MNIVKQLLSIILVITAWILQGSCTNFDTAREPFTPMPISSSTDTTSTLVSTTATVDTSITESSTSDTSTTISTLEYECPPAPYTGEYLNKWTLTKTNGEIFGNSVSIYNDRALIGFNIDNGFEPDINSAYIYKYNGLNWEEEAHLIPSHWNGGEYIGRVVSIYGNRAIIGANSHKCQEHPGGVVYIFKFTERGWEEETMIIANDSGYNTWHSFGITVSLYENQIAVGSPYDYNIDGKQTGAVYIFEYNGMNWEQKAELFPNDGDERDYFGSFVSLYQDRVLIGSHFDDDNGPYSGSAYIFAKNGSVWEQEAKLLAPDGQIGDFFGYDISLYLNRAVISSRQCDGNYINNPDVYIHCSSAIYIYQLVDNGWYFEKKIVFPDLMGDYFFDNPRVSIFGNTIIIATVNRSLGSYMFREIFVYKFNGIDWIEDTRLMTDSCIDFWGDSSNVSIFNNFAIIGNSSANYSHGTATIYQLPED